MSFAKRSGSWKNSHRTLCKATNKPFIFTYFKDAEISTASANKKDLMSLLAFQERLDNLGHFYTVYKNIDEMLLKFDRQLDKLATNGFIELKPDRNDAESSGATRQQAKLTGAGAIVQGSGTAVGAGGVYVGGKNTGDINTGTRIDTHGGAYVDGPVEVLNGHFIGRDFIQPVPNVIQGGEDPEEAKSVIASYLHALAADLWTFIARYTVTVAQFKVFVDATGFRIGEDHALLDPDSRPVRYVSWNEALAYCGWLNEVLKTSPGVASSNISRRVQSDKWRVDLPSELEWEKAAHDPKHIIWGLQVFAA